MYQQTSASEIAGFTRKGIRNAFLAALLVAGDSEQAEAATAHAIRSIDGPDVSDEALIVAALKAAISSSQERAVGDWDLDGELSFLPPALKCLSRLGMDHRNCFVLRMLVGLSREECSRVLGRSPKQIDEVTCTAMVNLAAGISKLSEE
jgi:DNA-directed RNA polymerase specialized sigma24 family protein